MPKYYRFRATTPTRKGRPMKDKDKGKQVQKSDKPAEGMLGLTLICAQAPPWYLRRTAWRVIPSIMGPIQHFASVAGRPVFVVKMRSPDFARYL